MFVFFGKIIEIVLEPCIKKFDLVEEKGTFSAFFSI